MSIRLATVTATGRRYVVQQIDFRTERVHAWGPVIGYRGLKTQHGASVSFAPHEVTLTEVEKTPALVASLFEEEVAARRTAGHVLTGRKNVIDHGPR